MSPETANLKARARSFRLHRSPMTCGRAAFWTAAISYPAVFVGQLTLASLSSVVAISLSIRELVGMRKRIGTRHPGLAVVGLLLGLPIAVLPMLLWPAQQAIHQASIRPRECANGTLVMTRPGADWQFVPVQQSDSTNPANMDASAICERQRPKIAFLGTISSGPLEEATVQRAGLVASGRSVVKTMSENIKMEKISNSIEESEFQGLPCVRCDLVGTQKGVVIRNRFIIFYWRAHMIQLHLVGRDNEREFENAATEFYRAVQLIAAPKSSS